MFTKSVIFFAIVLFCSCRSDDTETRKPAILIANAPHKTVLRIDSTTLDSIYAAQMQKAKTEQQIEAVRSAFQAIRLHAH